MFSRFGLSRLAFCCGLVLFVLTTERARSLNGDLIFGDLADAERSGIGSVVNSASITIRAGRYSGPGQLPRRNAIFVFDLNSISQPLVSADLGLFYVSSTGNVTRFNGDLWGVGFNSTTAFPATATFKANSNADPPNVLIQNDFVTSSTTTGVYVNTDAAGDTNLLNYLNSRPAGPAGRYVFFRVNQDRNPGGSPTSRGYNFASANAAGFSMDPVLFVVIPEPNAMTALFLIGMLVWLGTTRTRRGKRIALA